MGIRFDPLPDNRVLSEKIISQISDAIIGGELKPGDRLPPEAARRAMLEHLSSVERAIQQPEGEGDAG